jgi:hypothetical protein
MSRWFDADGDPSVARKLEGGAPVATAIGVQVGRCNWGRPETLEHLCILRLPDAIANQRGRCAPGVYSVPTRRERSYPFEPPISHSRPQASQECELLLQSWWLDRRQVEHGGCGAFGQANCLCSRAGKQVGSCVWAPTAKYADRQKSPIASEDVDRARGIQPRGWASCCSSG